jgi:hypothetical protein
VHTQNPLNFFLFQYNFSQIFGTGTVWHDTNLLVQKIKLRSNTCRITNQDRKVSTVRVADSGCLSRIPDPNFFIPDPGSKRLRIRIKEFKYFLPKNCFQALGHILDPDLDFLTIPDPGVKKATDPGSGTLDMTFIGCEQVAALRKILLLIFQIERRRKIRFFSGCH